MSDLNTAVILAAGTGTRMQPETKYVPKPMVQLEGKPLLAHLIDGLPPQINHIILVTGYLGQVVRAHFRDEYGGRSIEYAHQDMARGTADALRCAAEEFSLPYWFLFGFADDLQDPNAIAALCKQEGAAMLVHKTDDPTAYGIVETDEEGRYIRMHEKSDNPPPENLASTGLFKLPRKVLTYTPSVVGKKWELHHSGLVDGYVNDGGSVFCVEAERWFPISSLEDLDNARRVLPTFQVHSA